MRTEPACRIKTATDNAVVLSDYRIRTTVFMPNPLIPTPAESIADVIQKMQDIDAALPDSDGLKWFNYLYLAVTVEVKKQLDAGPLLFSDPAWIDRLDVVFANLYFAAIATATQQGTHAVPDAWRPLLDNRTAPGRARIQFALAGMNAHINRDLVFALLSMYQADGRAPDRSSAAIPGLRAGQPTPPTSGATGPPDSARRNAARKRRRLSASGNYHRELERGQRPTSRVGSQRPGRSGGCADIQGASLDALDGLTELAGNGLMIRVIV